MGLLIKIMAPVISVRFSIRQTHRHPQYEEPVTVAHSTEVDGEIELLAQIMVMGKALERAIRISFKEVINAKSVQFIVLQIDRQTTTDGSECLF